MGSLFGFVSHPMELGLIWLSHAVGSAGIGIILFTIFVRLVLSPLQITQLRNAKKMQKLQPLIAELRHKHGHDREQLSKATMQLYKEHNANPVLGCLPTLIQFPILIGLFYGLLHLGQSPTVVHGVITSTCNGYHPHTMGKWLSECYAVNGTSVGTASIYKLFHAQFLWLIHGLGKPDPFYILPILAGVTQWIQSRMMLTQSSDPQQQTMNTLMNFMPLIIVFFALRYASGLPLYWVTSTLIGIAIQARITGWGLLPRPSTILSSGGPIAALLPGGSAPRPARPARQEKRIEGTGPITSGGKGSSNGNGSNADDHGNGASPVNGAARNGRRRANRARGGGRQGGRRG